MDWALGTGHWALGNGLDSGHCALGTGEWTGQWALCTGHWGMDWTVGTGHWGMDWTVVLERKLKQFPSTLPPLVRKSRKPVLANKYYVKSFNAQISTTY